MPVKEKLTLKKNFVLVGLLLFSVACTPEKGEQLAETTAVPLAKSEASTMPDEIMDKATQKAVDRLHWVEQFDSKKEADLAVQAADFRLLVIAKRGPNVPGVNLNQQASLKEKCGEKVLEGIGDIQYGDAHKRLYEKAVQLASEYNKIITEQCVKAEG